MDGGIIGGSFELSCMMVQYSTALLSENSVCPTPGKNGHFVHQLAVHRRGDKRNRRIAGVSDLEIRKRTAGLPSCT